MIMDVAADPRVLGRRGPGLQSRTHAFDPKRKEVLTTFLSEYTSLIVQMPTEPKIQTPAPLVKEVHPSLEDLIHPVEPREFFDRYWEKEHLHLSRGEPDFYRPIFTLADVDRWIAASTREGGEQLVVRAPEGKVLRSTAPGKVPLEELYDGIGSGQSLILRAIHESWPPLLPVIAVLEEAFSARVKINLYLSPPGATGFPRHIDYHDFFIFQLHGSKEWFLYDYDYLPVERLEYGPYPAFREGTARSTPLRHQLRLEQGDLLYVPRGMPHHAAAVDDLSLHLTVSFHPLYWMDLLKAAVEEVGVRNERLQRALPPGFLSDPKRREGMEEVFAACLATLAGNASFPATLAAVTESLVRKPRPYADGHFSQLVRLDELTMGSEVERRPGLLCSVDLIGEEVVIRYGGGHLRGPAALGPALEFICDHRRFTPADLPQMSDSGRMTLVRRLIRGGLLRAVAS
jgi:ribosomal protein L16 Arg81 hydroxylase